MNAIIISTITRVLNLIDDIGVPAVLILPIIITEVLLRTTPHHILHRDRAARAAQRRRVTLTCGRNCNGVITQTKKHVNKSSKATYV